MRTEALILALAADPPRRSAPSPRRFACAGLAAALASAALLTATLGVRSDMAAALRRPAFAFKYVFALACLLSTGPLCLRLARPEAPARIAAALWPALAVWAGGVAIELLATPSGQWAGEAWGRSPFACAALISALSVLPVAALLAALRTGAPTKPAMAGAAAGLCGGAIGAAVFALFCPNDSALFVGLWYVSALALVGVGGAVAGHKFLAW